MASRESARKAQTAALAGLFVLLVSLVLFLLPETHIYVGFAGVFGFVLGVSLLTGVVLVYPPSHRKKDSWNTRGGFLEKWQQEIFGRI